MALLLAPYNSSMRLGSGFNSYTQQLCIDNAVVHDETGSRSNDSLGPLGKGSEVAQSVVFKTEIIEKMSDLTDALGIDGAMNIKASNIANARGTGTFVNSNLIKESDLNFLITCKVVNQVVQDTSLIKFLPLPNTVSNFTDVFGDCFISGFQVGGEFTALISIKVHDKSQFETIAAEANIAFTTPNFVSKEDAAAADEKAKQAAAIESKNVEHADKNAVAKAGEAGQSKDSKQKSNSEVAAQSNKGQQGISIDADAKIKKVRDEIISQNTVTISVSWTGGGQDLKSATEDWNFETLRAAAIKFPDLVARTPVRTHAVLTKYTALRSYHMAMSKDKLVSPLSYENAGVYTTMLQDAYLDYKNLYKELQLLSIEVDARKKILLPGKGLGKAIEETSAGKEDVKAGTRSEEVSNLKAVETPDSEGARTPATWQLSTQEPSVKPFDLSKPYANSLVGLEFAKRDIRTNMSRILLEVDKIAKAPEIVLDEGRSMEFMSPILFKQYVPIGAPYVEA